MDTENRKKLTNKQFLALPFFKWSLFKRFLLHGYSEPESKKKNEEYKEEEEERVKILEDNVPHIDFKKFVTHLSVFNWKTSDEIKMKCNS